MSGPTRSAAPAAVADRASIRPDARIDDGDVDGVRGHERDGPGELHGPPENVLARNGVREVDDPRVRRDLRHDAMTDAHEAIAPAVVGQEDDRSAHPFPESETGTYRSIQLIISVLTIPAWLPVRMSVPWSPVVRISGTLRRQALTVEQVHGFHRVDVLVAGDEELRGTHLGEDVGSRFEPFDRGRRGEGDHGADVPPVVRERR